MLEIMRYNLLKKDVLASPNSKNTDSGKNKELSSSFNSSNIRFGNKKQEEIESEHAPEDTLIPADRFTQLKAGCKQTSKLPEYAVNGLKGDPNANFFEFLKLGSIPYWLGGPVLVWAFGAGGKGAAKITKQKAVGVGFYYAGAALAKTLVDTPVSLFKGIDLNKKYKDIVYLKAEEKNEKAQYKEEYHKVYESVDFTRWDLLYNQNPTVSADPVKINENYDKLAKKMGIDSNLNDSDSEVKPYTKKVLAASSAWKSVLIIPLAGIAGGLSHYEGWENLGRGLKKELSDVFSAKSALSTMERTKKLMNISNDHLFSHVKNSFVNLWKGEGKTGNINKNLGKAYILGSIATVALANFNILRISKVKKEDEPEVPEQFKATSRLLAANKLKTNFAEFAETLASPNMFNSEKNEYIL
ncbi:MAG TPA: hypothetical protein P5556_00400 [Candidatus Gastranaerophilales bacterium]|nr:hypothetical protein [Candidatus Gastranaerophilales bacterium]